jgi:hypothetical protein
MILMRTYWSETLQRHVTIPDDTEETTMTQSPESASTPISMGGWKYNPNDAQDVADFEHHGAGELVGLERNRGLDFTDHPARQDHGTLTDYTTGEAIRPATAAEHAQSLAAGETGAYADDELGTVFVAGGPEIMSTYRDVDSGVEYEAPDLDTLARQIAGPQAEWQEARQVVLRGPSHPTVYMITGPDPLGGPFRVAVAHVQQITPES